MTPREQAVAAFKDGTSAKAISASLGVSERTIRRWVKSAGCAMQTVREVDPAVKAAVLADLVDWPGSLASLAAEHGVTAKTLKRWKKHAPPPEDLAYKGGWVRDGLILRPAS